MKRWARATPSKLRLSTPWPRSQVGSQERTPGRTTFVTAWESTCCCSRLKNHCAARCIECASPKISGCASDFSITSHAIVNHHLEYHVIDEIPLSEDGPSQREQRNAYKTSDQPKQATSCIGRFRRQKSGASRASRLEIVWRITEGDLQQNATGKVTQVDLLSL